MRRRKKEPTLAEILTAATRAKPPYRLGNKVLIDRVAGELGVRVEQLAPTLIRMNRAGEIRLARIDLTAAFDRVKSSLKRSYVAMPGFAPDGVHGWHAIDLDGVH